VGHTIRLDTDNYIQLTRYEDKLTNAAITNATVTADLYNDATDAQLGTQITLSHVSDGLYRGSISYNISGMTAGLRVRVVIFADGGSGKRMTKTLKVTVLAGK
jgi:hypothetical protein